MYYSATKQEIKELNIHHTTLTNHLEKGTYYLKKYVFSRDDIGGAKAVGMSIAEVKAMLEQDRVHHNKNKSAVHSKAKGVLITHEASKQEVAYESLESCLTYLRGLGHKANRQTLVKLLDTNEPYYGYICRKGEK